MSDDLATLARRLEDEFKNTSLHYHFTGEEQAAIVQAVEDQTGEYWHHRARDLDGAVASLLPALKDLVARIDANGGLGEYQGGPPFVMKAARDAIAEAEALKTAQG